MGSSEGRDKTLSLVLLSRRAVILVIMFVEKFKTDVIVFVDHVIVC
jgi:hypothetical protein